MDIYLLIDGRQEGPYTEEQVRQSLASRGIPADLPAWREGLGDWVQVKGLLDVGGITPETRATIPQRWKPAYGYVVGGVIVIVALSAMLLTGKHTNRPLPPPAPASSPQVTSQHPVVPSSSVAVPSITASPTGTSDPKDTPNVGEVQKWLEDKIETYGGRGKAIFKPLHLVTTTSYHDVLVNGDALSWTVLKETSNGVSNSYEVKYNLEAIEPRSFRYVPCDMTKLQDWDNIDDPVVTYDIAYTSKANVNPFYTDNPNKHTEFVIKDEDIAKRVVKALNYLSTQAKAGPF